ncbi:MAG: glycosyltransferase family 2 protein [Rhodobacteraceae bacterium]|nr:glycosyltransferase family 2 protein [Paracoccaceae bacterium]
MKLSQSYRLRLLRKRWQIRTLRKKAELVKVHVGKGASDRDGIFVFSTVRNERHRLPYFLKYYRDLGITHFFFIDNDSSDGTDEYLKSQPDVSIWHTTASYKRASFGIVWTNHLLNEYGSNHWCLCVDCDEFLTYPHVTNRPIRALTDWLDARSIRSFPAMLLDMYSKNNVESLKYHVGQNPFEILDYFDAGNYSQRRDGKHGNLWIQGGPRQRKFFSRNPSNAPALNKIPLVKWKSSYVYTSSTHSLLPRSLNLTYDEHGGEKISGCLLHGKFLPDIGEKVSEEKARNQHYASGQEYHAYGAHESHKINFWTPQSSKYSGWQQLEELGLMSCGGWA